MPDQPTDHDAQETLTVLRMELDHIASKLTEAIADKTQHPDVLMSCIAMQSQIRRLINLANPR
jgi:hypothetical protein